jgi:hypothetical protein
VSAPPLQAGVLHGLHLADLGYHGANPTLDPVLDGHGGDGACSAGPGQPELEDPLLVHTHELDIAAVDLQSRAVRIERRLDSLAKSGGSVG